MQFLYSQDVPTSYSVVLFFKVPRRPVSLQTSWLEESSATELHTAVFQTSADAEVFDAGRDGRAGHAPIGIAGSCIWSADPWDELEA